jgi:hypothetical protein
MHPKEIVENLRFLKQSGTLVTLRLPDRGYERLTMVIEIRERNGAPWFRIDRPRDFGTVAACTENVQAVLEFTGMDHLHYILHTGQLSVCEAQLWIPVPADLKRIQRRHHFRIEAPSGAVLRFDLKGQPREMHLINISIRGALGLPIRLKREDLHRPLLEVGHTLLEAEMVFPRAEGVLHIPVERLIVRRIQPTPNDQFAFGMEFQALDKAAERRLTEQVLWLQRQMLQRRMLEKR